MTLLNRRAVLLGAAGVAAGAAVTGCSAAADTAASATFAPADPLSPSPGQRVVTKTLTPKPVTLDLGGPTVKTWAYGDTAPGPLIRGNAGDVFRLTLDNQLPAESTIHWHGLRLRNVADGVPGLTQEPTAEGEKYLYEFVAPDPGTYWYHPHVGVQLDRGLYGPLIIDDPKEKGDYDREWIIILDDWLDGTGRTPEEEFANLQKTGGGSMMGHQNTGPGPWSLSGDVEYPHFLLNGRVPESPETFEAKPGERIRLRFINAAADTIFTVAVGGHVMTVTHTDGWPVEPEEARAIYVGMGERYDATITVKDGVFPLTAVPWFKKGTPARALLRSGSGSAPKATVVPKELSQEALIGANLTPAESSRLPTKTADAAVDVVLQGSMNQFVWGINGGVYGENDPLSIKEGQRVQINTANQSMMTHPLHVHGHTFALPSGLRKDTLLMAPMNGATLHFDADNPGRWMVHCHNLYHGEAGMMVEMKYA